MISNRILILKLHIIILFLMTSCGGYPSGTTTITVASKVTATLSNITQGLAAQPPSQTSSPPPAPTAPETPTSVPIPTISPTSQFPGFDEKIRLEVVGQIGGKLTAMLVVENIVYLAAGPRLIALDVSDPANIVQLDESDLLPALGNDLSIAGERVYWISSDGWLLVFDVSDLHHLKVLYQIEIEPGGQSIAVHEMLAFVGTGMCEGVASHNSLQIFELSNETAPQILVELEMPDLVREVIVEGQRIWIRTQDCRADNGNLLKVDISNPKEPQIISTLSIETGGIFKLAPPYAFAIPRDMRKNVLVYALLASTSLEPIASWPLEIVPTLFINDIQEFESVGSVLFTIELGPPGDVAVGGNSYIRGLDISNPTTPKIIADREKFPRLLSVIDVVASGERLYVLQFNRLTILDLQDPGDPRELGSYLHFSTEADLCGLTVGNGWVYAGNDSSLDSLFVFDVSNPTQPHQFGPFPPSQAMEGVVEGGILYLPLFSGLSVLDVSQPETPQQVTFWQNTQFFSPMLGSSQKSIAVRENVLYMTLAGATDEVGMIDVSTPTLPRFIDTFKLTETGNIYIVSTATDTHYLYLLARPWDSSVNQSHLYVFDLTDPMLPELVSMVEMPIYGLLTVEKNMLYVTGGAIWPEMDSLAVIDVSDPSQPFVSGEIELLFWVNNIALSGNYLFLASGSDGLWVIDISNAKSPGLVGHLDTGAPVFKVAVEGEWIYAIVDGKGLVVIHFQKE